MNTFCYTNNFYHDNNSNIIYIIYFNIIIFSKRVLENYKKYRVEDRKSSLFIITS